MYIKWDDVTQCTLLPARPMVVRCSHLVVPLRARYRLAVDVARSASEEGGTR